VLELARREREGPAVSSRILCGDAGPDWLMGDCVLVTAYKQLLAVEPGCVTSRARFGCGSVFQYREDSIRAHIQLCWLTSSCWG
jgi:hypothetical protein